MPEVGGDMVRSNEDSQIARAPQSARAIERRAAEPAHVVDEQRAIAELQDALEDRVEVALISDEQARTFTVPQSSDRC